MDVDMPFMEGKEATQKIRSYLKQMKINQPFIAACTGHSDQKSFQECLNAGMDIVLMKPCNPEELQSILKKIKNNN